MEVRKISIRTRTPRHYEGYKRIALKLATEISELTNLRRALAATIFDNYPPKELAIATVTYLLELQPELVEKIVSELSDDTLSELVELLKKAEYLK